HEVGAIALLAEPGGGGGNREVAVRSGPIAGGIDGAVLALVVIHRAEQRDGGRDGVVGDSVGVFEDDALFVLLELVEDGRGGPGGAVVVHPMAAARFDD